jgi:hypothetical protein
MGYSSKLKNMLSGNLISYVIIFMKQVVQAVR